MRSFYHIIPEKWFVLFWMCEFVALTRCCKLVSFLCFISIWLSSVSWSIIYTVQCTPKNRARILWPITFTNIDQHQCHLIELFVQHYLINCHKNYSHNRVPAATVGMATSALLQTKACANSTHMHIVHVPPSSIYATTSSHLIWFLPTFGYLIATT